ncbi:hypothetical protein BD309DRAFT_869258 [Dichomitus squalens]|uniref:Uncharacterized protein n=2 Tax=Dichomitus squalens TaxID=114155 RepID=A0A4Q9NI89_9APHY|nr:uncharacterized protein DICSQDRAFT_155965 [Dichomitus squalens LYAD-421 SS1]EJF59991.1 hypothetical protein DICSQDRAFT_155965 [Dichomitus squalens LYAD-421 SS1]TBU40944.1 hypothetical protein BD309DRAFT_869258 [Dichomitus squalens]TBU51938.1 hypothetical protein BD310DRAFT_833286 [Dichomitus squalens]
MQSTTAEAVICADAWPRIGFALQAALGTASPSILRWKTDEWRRGQARWTIIESSSRSVELRCVPRRRESRLGRGHTGTPQQTASDVNAVTRHITTVARMAKLA